LITLAILDGSGTTLATQAINTLNPGDDLAEFSLAYSATGTESGNIQVRITSGAGNTSGVYVVDDASLTIATPSYNSENLQETVRWVNVDTQLGVGGPVKKYWQHRHDQISARGSSKVGLAFVGDSISDLTTTELQTNPYVLVDSANKPLYEATWAGRYKPANYGIAGQVTQNIRWQIANGVYGDAAKPQVISLMVGTNNLHQNALGSGSSPVALNDADNRLDTVTGIKAVVNDLKAWSPNSTILLNSILPRNFNGNDPVSNTLVEQVNSDIAAWAATQDGVSYVDVYSLFSNGSGGIKPELYISDQLHPNTAGYQVWFDALQPLVDSEIPVGPDHIRHLAIPEHTATVPAKPEYADLEAAGGFGFGWNQIDKTETWTEAFNRNRGLPLTQEAEIVFLGDSVTMAWGRVGGRTTVFSRGTSAWNTANFDQYNAVNAGMSGDKVENLLWRIENGQMDGIAKPKLLVVMIGTNNREASHPTLTPSFDGPHTSEQIANGVLKVVQKLQALYPNTHILCHGFLRGANNTDPERIAAVGANAIVEQAFKLDTNPYLHYLDLNPFFINGASANEAYQSTLMNSDSIHPKGAGYTAWVNAVQPFIDKYVVTANSANNNRGEDETAFDSMNWQNEVSSGTAAAETLFTPVNQNAGTTVDLSGISAEATYEFIVEAEDISQTAATLLSESGSSFQLEQGNDTGLIGLTSSGTHQFTPFYGTSVSSPYGGINHLVLRVHSGEGFSHLFLNGERVGTLNRTYTFNSASAALANVAASPLGADNEPVILGFAAYNSLLTDTEISRHHSAAFCYELPKVSFTNCPADLQLYPRDPSNVLAVDVPISGTVLETGYDSVVAQLTRNGVAHGSEIVAPLSYSGDQASFSLTPSILPELAQYDLNVYLRSGSIDTLVKTAKNIVAGDVYIIQGQSNAYARIWDGSANENLSPYLRSFGTNPIFKFGESSNEEAQRAGYTEADTHWHYAIADEDVDNTDDDRAPGHIGQIGARIGAQLIANHQVPVAVLTGAHGGKQLSFFARNDSDVNDTQTNYGRLLWRAEQAGVEDSIRGLIFCQGENDEGIINNQLSGSQTPANYNTEFATLYDAWQSDFDIAQHYAIQVRPRCYGWIDPSDTRLRDLQRRWADEHDNLSVFSYNAVTGQHSDFCHYAYENGYETMGNQLATAIGRDLYGLPDTGNIDAPNPRKASFSNAGKTEITIQMRELDDQLIADAGVAPYFQLEQADGTAISSPTITDVTVNAHTLVLTLSAAAPANAARVGFQSHKYEASGDYWITNANGIGMLTFSETLEASLTPIEEWQKDTLGVAPGSDIKTDTDNDGLDELTEYALGTNPLAASNSDPALPIIEMAINNDTKFPELRYQRPDSTSDIQYIAEWSSDLIDWSSAPADLAPETINALGQGTLEVRIQSTRPSETNERQFMRLKVQQSSN
jgi:lysophospholipase L1-like esterase